MNERNTEGMITESPHIFDDSKHKLDRTSDYLKEFILKFESLPVLWDSTNKYYRHKAKRLKAIEKLTVMYRFIKPNATLEDTRKKINSLRSNYRKELKKIAHSKTEDENVYTPTSRVFHMLKFLNKCEEHNIKVTTSQKYESNDDSLHGNCEDSLIHTDSVSNTCSYNTTSTPPKKTPVFSRETDILDTGCKYVIQSSNPTFLADINPTALYWSHKLENLEREQKYFAEKAINDILFEAELGLLTRYSVNINVPQN